jgi:FkbM family methyltransferase
MKKVLVNSLHSLFRIPFFEKILLSLVKGAKIGSFASKFIPPNYTYPSGSLRLADSDGFRISANLNDYNDWKAYWNLREKERENLYELAADCKTIVDVGVNNGWLLMHMARLVKAKNGKVFGFEPHPDTYRRCMKNINDNQIDNAVVFNLGCGNEPATLKMISEIATNSGQNRIIVSAPGRGATTSVQVVKLDDQLRELKKIDLIKIDVEGFEHQVLNGAGRILKENKPVLFIEIDDKLLRANGSSAEALIQQVRKYDYQVYLAETKELLSASHPLVHCHFDIICR